MKTKLDDVQKAINDIVYTLYEINNEDKKVVEDYWVNCPSILSEKDTESRSLITYFISYVVGIAFGRWDIRYSIGEKQPPPLQDPFAPLPACSPGMLQGDDGLPLYRISPGIPIEHSVEWNSC